MDRTATQANETTPAFFPRVAAKPAFRTNLKATGNAQLYIANSDTKIMTEINKHAKEALRERSRPSRQHSKKFE
ncbi:hypothetical protein [Stenotrophomonas terrae]|uniref:hypothetical protein n=1 Tax=Stenotrophomonas terrae TaxID=405446 RepID=UPI00137995D1|nr:hypothetical protein [Stenotrophomonas terrae]